WTPPKGGADPGTSVMPSIEKFPVASRAGDSTAGAGPSGSEPSGQPAGMSTTSRRNRSTAAGSGVTIFTWLRRSMSVGRVVDRAGTLDADREAEAADGGVGGRPQAVHLVGRDVDEIPGDGVTLLAADGHAPRPRHHEVELVRRVRVGEPLAADPHLELVRQLEVPAVGEVLHL